MLTLRSYKTTSRHDTKIIIISKEAIKVASQVQILPSKICRHIPQNIKAYSAKNQGIFGRKSIGMENKPIQYTLSVQTATVGKLKGQQVQQARAFGRKRISFRNFCERVAQATTFTRQEVQAVLNYASEIAKDYVANGDIVEYGDLGTLTPSFKSVIVPVGTKFNANVHITKPVVRLSPSKKYFSLEGMVSFEQAEKPSKGKKSSTDGKVETESGGEGAEGGKKPDSGL